MIDCICVNEFTAWRLLRASKSHQVVILSVDPLCPKFANLLKRLVSWAEARGAVHSIADLCPELRWLITYPPFYSLYDVFGMTESWCNNNFNFIAIEQRIPKYSFAYKSIVCNYIELKHYPIILLETITNQLDLETLRVYGLSDDTIGAFEAYTGQSVVDICRKHSTWLNHLVNLLIWVIIAGFTCLQIIKRIKVTPCCPEKVFLVADYIDDPRDFRLYHELQDGGPIVLVPRRQELDPAIHQELDGYFRAQSTDGVFGIIDGLIMLNEALSDLIRLGFLCHRCYPSLFYRLLALPWRRAISRSFFNRFHSQYYWGRDDYNVEHILRREELNRTGGKSQGVSHGYYYATEAPRRYISFDRYYVFGKVLHEIMQETWAKDMEVIEAGSFAANREDYKKINVARSEDIVIYISYGIGYPAMAAFIRNLAIEFPNRTIYLQIKDFFNTSKKSQDFIKVCAQGLLNIKITHKPLFELFRTAKYGFSDPSTVVAEGIQFGQIMHVIDIFHEQKRSIFRYYPTLCIRSAHQAASRIRDLELKRTKYPLKKFKGLVDLSGKIFFDVVREGMGLMPKND